MGKTAVQRLAGVLKILVTITFACNLVVLPMVPRLVRMRYVEPWIYQEMLWDSSLVWRDSRAVVLIFFLWFCGCCTAVILWQARRVLRTVLQGEPFSMENASSLKRAAVCAFLISLAAFLRTAWGIWYYQSVSPLSTYNALFIPIFLMGGLLCLVMSALFRQAAELKAENDLTI